VKFSRLPDPFDVEGFPCFACFVSCGHFQF
jgi:hypothetical protein